MFEDSERALIQRSVYHFTHYFDQAGGGKISSYSV